MIYIIHPDTDIWNYVLQGLDDGRNILTRPLNQYCSWWQLIIRKILSKCQLFDWLLFNSQLRHELRNLSENDSIVICDYCDLCLIRTISSTLHNSVKKFFWIWNPINTKEYNLYKKIFEEMKERGITPSTFDPHDSKFFDIKLYNQFFRAQISNPINNNILFDFYFIGYAKQREKSIHDLRKQLGNYRTFFKIVHNNSESIPYIESIENIKHSLCIVDIVQPNQEGMTLRPLEGLTFRKKIISNNKNLIDADFYHPHNIFILGKDSINEIETFLNTPYYAIGDEIIQKYDVKNWISHFM